MKTSELTGPKLDWAVAKCEATLPNDVAQWLDEYRTGTGWPWCYSNSWAQGGPIIEREGLGLYQGSRTKWWAHVRGAGDWSEEGTTPLIAAMRCYVTSKLGADIAIPKELL